MKTALVKQAFDIFGPWSSVKWQDTSPLALFEVWPSKAVYWELTCMLKADWYVIPHAVPSDYSTDAVERHPQRVAAMRKYVKNVIPTEQIPFDEYDLVITFDAILDVPKRSAVFAYYAEENWDRLYRMSLRRPVEGYDLFLAHMMDADYAIDVLPQAISFPYVHDSDLVRAIFPAQKQERAWIDWRTLKTLANLDLADVWSPEAEAAAKRFPEIIGFPVSYRGKPHEQTYGFADPPNWGDAAEYLEGLSRCKYYIGVGRIGGAGQGLAEAASVGCLCIGQANKVYHRAICHPACLCEDIAEMPRRFRALSKSKSLQEEVLAFQDDAVHKHFTRGPLGLLNQAVLLKSAGANQDVLGVLRGG